MIFRLHLISFIFVCLGLVTAYILTNFSIFNNTYVKLFIIFFCFGVTVHVLILDVIGNGINNFITYCINLKGWEGKMRDDKRLRFKFLISELLTKQQTLPHKNKENEAGDK